MAANNVPVSSSPSDDETIDDQEIDELDELDEEVDQLQPEVELEPSEDEGPPRAPSKTAAKKKKRAAGTVAVPIEQIDALLRVDGIADTMSKEASFLLSVATERFIKRLAGVSTQSPAGEPRPIVTYRDISAPTLQYQELMFLQDAIPTPIPLSEALRRRSEKSTELTQDPSVPPPSVLPSFVHTSTIATQAISRNRTKANAARSQASASTNSRSRPTTDRDNAFNPGGSKSARKPAARASSSRQRSASARANGYEEQDESDDYHEWRSSQWDQGASRNVSNANSYGMTSYANGTHSVGSSSLSRLMAPPVGPGVSPASVLAGMDRHIEDDRRRWQQTGPGQPSLSTDSARQRLEERSSDQSFGMKESTEERNQTQEGGRLPPSSSMLPEPTQDLISGRSGYGRTIYSQR